MKVTLLHKAFDCIPSPLATLPFFADTRPLREAMGVVDWRLNGRLSQFIEEERVEGEMGEALFVPTNGRIRADTLILYGLGERAKWDPKKAESNFIPWIEKLVHLNKERWLVSLSGLTDDFLSWRHAVRSFVHVAVASEKPACRHLFMSERDDWVLEAKKRHMDFGSEVKLNFDLSPVT